MSNPRFFSSDALRAGERLELSENAARHACRVLRLGEGDGLILFDGNGGEYDACIAAVARDRVTVDVIAHRPVESEAPFEITLVQALQTGDKMDMTVQKAVELGVTRIVPVSSRRSVLRLQGERAERRVEHWRGVVVSACEQCGRNRVPEVTALSSLEHWLGCAQEFFANAAASDDVLRLMLAPGAEFTLNQIDPPKAGGKVELLIGAEGGLAPDEVEKAKQAGYVAVRLGPRILRTETAGLAALAAMQCLWGDFLQ